MKDVMFSRWSGSTPFVRRALDELGNVDGDCPRNYVLVSKAEIKMGPWTNGSPAEPGISGAESVNRRKAPPKAGSLLTRCRKIST